jgi:excisionase family DNA binding protein
MPQDARVEALRSMVCANLCTDAELAEVLGVSRRTVYRFTQRGLPVVKIGARRWVDATAASAWLAANCVLAPKAA